MQKKEKFKVLRSKTTERKSVLADKVVRSVDKNIGRSRFSYA